MMKLFSLPRPLPDAHGEELFETLLTGKNGLLVERIVSNGHATPEGQWYDQQRDEWVAVLEGSASIAYENGESVSLHKGDTLFLPKGKRHRVTRSSSPCIWLAVHGNELLPAR